MQRRLVVVLLLLIAAACGSSPQRPANPLDKAIAERPNDAVLLYLRAVAAPAEALPFLERMDALGWDVPLLPHEFTPLHGDERYKAIVARIAARAPRVARSEVAFTLPDADMIPEGITVDPRSGTFFVGSLRKRTVLAVDAAGATRTFADAGDGLLAVVGIKVDVARDLLWVTSWKSSSYEGAGEGAAAGHASALIAFRIADGGLARRVRLPFEGEHLPNDMAITEDGTVYVTDSMGGAVWRLAPDADALAPLVAPGTLEYPNGITIAADGSLFVAHALGLARVQPTTGAVERVESDGAGVLLGGIDGLIRDGNRLLAVQNGLGEARIVAFGLDALGMRVTGMTVLENDPAALAIATTSCIAGGALYTVANAQLDALGPAGIVAGKSLTPSRILRTPL